MTRFADEQNEKLKAVKGKTIEEIKIDDETYFSESINIIFTDKSQLHIPVEYTFEDINIIL
jgi:hypothetical protein